MPPSATMRLWLCLLVLSSLPAQAVILLTGDNSANQSAPDAARTDIFNAVAQVVNGAGVGGFGSAVAIRGKYMLTANHVRITDANHVTFDGATIYARDTTFAPVQIGTSDLLLFKLVEDPGLNEVKLFDAAEGDVPYSDPLIYTTATIIGVGIGRDPNDLDGNTIWNWGANATMVKRWGVNRIEGTFSITPEESPPYTYQALTTTLETTSGNDEAAVTRYDSGCGLFIEHEGEWKLAGIATSVETLGSSTFDEIDSDGNFYVRINQVAADIEVAIPDLGTFAGWKVDHGLSGSSADDDGDGDGIPLLVEFALGGDPTAVDSGILPAMQVVEDGGSRYLEMTMTRPSGLSGIVYVPQTHTAMFAWPTDSSGIANANPAPQDNGDGTEDVTYRRAQAMSESDMAFMRLRVEISP